MNYRLNGTILAQFPTVFNETPPADAAGTYQHDRLPLAAKLSVLLLWT